MSANWRPLTKRQNNMLRRAAKSPTGKIFAFNAAERGVCDRLVARGKLVKVECGDDTYRLCAVADEGSMGQGLAGGGGDV
jgi:hypothetical protein